MSVDNCCEDEIDALKKELKFWSEKSENLKLEYGKKLIENLKKDIEIRDLNKKSDSKKFNSFKETLSPHCLEAIKKIDNSPSKDSVFIRYALKDLYSTNNEIIKKLTSKMHQKI